MYLHIAWIAIGVVGPIVLFFVVRDVYVFFKSGNQQEDENEKYRTIYLGFSPGFGACESTSFKATPPEPSIIDLHSCDNVRLILSRPI